MECDEDVEEDEQQEDDREPKMRDISPIVASLDFIKVTRPLTNAIMPLTTELALFCRHNATVCSSPQIDHSGISVLGTVCSPCPQPGNAKLPAPYS